MIVESALVEYTNDKDIFSSSAILFNKRWILLPAASFLISLSSKKHLPIEIQHLDTSKLYTINYLNLTPDNLKVVTFNEQTKQYIYHLAKYVGIFSCINIKDTQRTFPLGCGDSGQSDLDYNSFLSLFILLDLQWNNCKFIKHELNEAIDKLVKLCSNTKVNRGYMTAIESAPFGCRDLIGSYSQGIICNFTGKNNCYILTDASTVPGCEGAPIYAFQNNNRYTMKATIGIVISSLNWWRGEHTGLTLGAMLAPLMNQLLPKKWNLYDMLFSKKDSVLNTVDNSIVQVFCGNGWGTGILIDKNMAIFITGSHVVKDAQSDNITLKWRNKKFPCELIYRTENTTPIYDIAILQCLPKHIEEMVPLKFTKKPAIKGENVLAAGYPIFNSEKFIFPVVTKGNISLVDNCILHTTCIILAGSSGGAILRENGELLGVIVCHTTVTIKNEIVVYPKINMAIPISAISKILTDYLKTKDASILKGLESNDIQVRNKWHLFQAKL